MATTMELFRAYQEQIGLESDDAIALLVDFLASYGMTDGAADVLCDHIDDQGMTEDFAFLLRENGLPLDPDIAEENENGLGSETTD